VTANEHYKYKNKFTRFSAEFLRTVESHAVMGRKGAAFEAL
jgi:hypothetical protein